MGLVVGFQKTGDHIAVLGLAPPRLENGTVVWDAAESDIARCFRQMSLQVHPDKNKSINAAVAFRGELPIIPSL